MWKPKEKGILYVLLVYIVLKCLLRHFEEYPIFQITVVKRVTLGAKHLKKLTEYYVPFSHHTNKYLEYAGIFYVFFKI